MVISMDKSVFSRGIKPVQAHITDCFFGRVAETVRREMLPYQWAALNDEVEGAAPSFCMKNFRLAGEIGKQRREKGQESLPVKPTNVFNYVPDKEHENDGRFHGFVFQDTDFSKWIEAVGYSLAQHPDAELEKTADEAIDIVCAAQHEDGYLDTYYLINDYSKRFTNLKDYHELYCLGHLIEGAIAYYEGTGKDKLLKAAMRFADCVCEYFADTEEGCKGYPGHEIAEMALVRLYEVTGEKKYLDMAELFIERRGTKPYYFDKETGNTAKADEERYGYYQSHKPVREQDEAIGHAVRAVYLYSGMADVAKYKEDTALFDACERLFDNIMNRKLYINGGIGASPEGEAFSYNYNLPNDKMYNETCASIGLIFFARRMLEMKPSAKYADVMEKALYNNVLAGMALDGKSFFYVNPLEVEPEGCRKDAQRRQVALPRQRWFGCACCPPNIARLVSSIASYAYSSNEDTMFMHLYIGADVEQTFDGKRVRFETESSYPWEQKVSVRIDTEQSALFTYAVRLPGWCNFEGINGCTGNSSVKLCVNGKELTEADGMLSINNGYAYIKREWSRGDVLDITIPMEPVFMQANTLVRADIGKTALMRGPLVYCIEEADNGAQLQLVSVNAGADIREVRENGELGDIVALYAEGRRIEEICGEGLYRRLKPYNHTLTELKYIPYYAWCNRGVGEMRIYTEWY